MKKLIKLKLIIILIASISITGCAPYGALPKGYSGDTVTIWDSVQELSSTKAYFFELIAVDGRGIERSSSITRERSFKLGFKMSANPISREIPVNSEELNIGGFNYLVADLFGFGDDTYRVKGKLHVKLENDTSYLISGELHDDFSAVWLEEEKTGIIVSDVILDGEVPAQYVSQLRENKIKMYSQHLADQSRKYESEKRLLESAIDYINSQGCESDTNSENSDVIFKMAEALFKNRMYRESLSCFESISHTPGVPRDLYKYLALIYDVGLGVEENPEQSAMWHRKYESTEQTTASDR